jgi:hypothetical protein
MQSSPNNSNNCLNASFASAIALPQKVEQQIPFSR